MEESGNIKQGQIHERLNEFIGENNPRKGLAHKIARKCLKEGKLYLIVL